MSWIIYALSAIGFLGVSDIFRKLASNIKDPLFANLIFQIGAMSAAVLTYLLFSRKVEYNPKLILFAIIGGMTIAIFTLFSFKVLSIGPGVSVVMPVLRIGGITLVAILGILFLKEKLTIQTFFGLIFSAIGLYLLFSNK